MDPYEIINSLIQADKEKLLGIVDKNFAQSSTIARETIIACNKAWFIAREKYGKGELTASQMMEISDLFAIVNKKYIDANPNK